jgi:hypothetical protein
MRKLRYVLMAWLVLAGVAAGMAVVLACSTPDLSGPVESHEVFKTNPDLPGTYLSLAPQECQMAGPDLQIDPNRLYRRPDQSSVKTTDSLLIYWSYCNKGDRDAAPAAAAYHLLATNTVTSVVQKDVAFDIPDVAPCVCIPGQHDFANELTAGTYRFELSDGFSTVPAVNEIVTAP